MKTLHLTVAVSGLLLATLAGRPAWADVLNMGGTRNADGSWTGLASLETVPVGDAGNTGQLSGVAADGDGPDRICGAVDYNYQVGKYEVTAGQYCEFLNKVAGMDTYGLYSTSMWSDSYGCKIERFAGNGTAGNPYQYRVAADRVNRPVNFVSFGDACRFANWLHNGQPSGQQGASTTQDGAYPLNGATSHTALQVVARKAGWRWAVPNEDEWYKAAYYKGGSADAGYWSYPTCRNTAPGQDMGDVSGNNANYQSPPYIWPIDGGRCMTVVGEFQNSASPYGTFDTGGNVWEWNETTITSIYGSCRGLRGGSCYSYIDIAGHVGLQASSRSYYAYASGEGVDMGFRVTSAPVVGDVDGDGHVDVVDLLYLVDTFGSVTGDANYDVRCDFNRDGAVDVVDLLDVIYNFGM